MAKPNLLSIKDGIATFTLSNKPRYEIKVTESDYETLIKNTTCYYVKEWKRSRKGKEEKVVESAYVVRGITGRCPSSGKQYCHTWFLHWDVIGQSCHWGDKKVVDHINRNTLDNSFKNLRIVDHYENRMNTVDVRENKVRTRYGIEAPRGYSIAIIKKAGKDFFQCYYKSKEYVKGSKTLKVVIDAIERHQKIRNVSRVNERAVA